MTNATINTINFSDLVDTVDGILQQDERILSVDEKSQKIREHLITVLKACQDAEAIDNLDTQIAEYPGSDASPAKKDVASSIVESLVMLYFDLQLENDAAIKFGEMFGFVPDYTCKFTGCQIVDAEKCAQNGKQGLGSLLAGLMRDMSRAR